eukprot:8481264-Pyramimonas_sp.AAC.1
MTTTTMFCHGWQELCARIEHVPHGRAPAVYASILSGGDLPPAPALEDQGVLRSDLDQRRRRPLAIGGPEAGPDVLVDIDRPSPPGSPRSPGDGGHVDHPGEEMEIDVEVEIGHLLEGLPGVEPGPPGPPPGHEPPAPPEPPPV